MSHQSLLEYILYQEAPYLSVYLWRVLNVLPDIMSQSDFSKLLLAGLNSDSWGPGELDCSLKRQVGFTRVGIRKEFNVISLGLLTLRYFSCVVCILLARQ